MTLPQDWTRFLVSVILLLSALVGDTRRAVSAQSTLHRASAAGKDKRVTVTGAPFEPSAVLPYLRHHLRFSGSPLSSNNSSSSSTPALEVYDEKAELARLGLVPEGPPRRHQDRHAALDYLVIALAEAGQDDVGSNQALLVEPMRPTNEERKLEFISRSADPSLRCLLGEGNPLIGAQRRSSKDPQPFPRSTVLSTNVPTTTAPSTGLRFRLASWVREVQDRRPLRPMFNEAPWVNTTWINQLKQLLAWPELLAEVARTKNETTFHCPPSLHLSLVQKARTTFDQVKQRIRQQGGPFGWAPLGMVFEVITDLVTLEVTSLIPAVRTRKQECSLLSNTEHWSPAPLSEACIEQTSTLSSSLNDIDRLLQRLVTWLTQSISTAVLETAKLTLPPFTRCTTASNVSSALWKATWYDEGEPSELEIQCDTSPESPHYCAASDVEKLCIKAMNDDHQEAHMSRGLLMPNATPAPGTQCIITRDPPPSPWKGTYRPGNQTTTVVVQCDVDARSYCPDSDVEIRCNDELNDLYFQYEMGFRTVLHKFYTSRVSSYADKLRQLATLTNQWRGQLHLEGKSQEPCAYVLPPWTGRSPTQTEEEEEGSVDEEQGPALHRVTEAMWEYVICWENMDEAKRSSRGEPSTEGGGMPGNASAPRPTLPFGTKKCMVPTARRRPGFASSTWMESTLQPLYMALATAWNGYLGQERIQQGLWTEVQLKRSLDPSLFMMPAQANHALFGPLIAPFSELLVPLQLQEKPTCPTWARMGNQQTGVLWKVLGGDHSEHSNSTTSSNSNQKRSWSVRFALNTALVRLFMDATNVALLAQEQVVACTPAGGSPMIKAKREVCRCRQERVLAAIALTQRHLTFIDEEFLEKVSQGILHSKIALEEWKNKNVVLRDVGNLEQCAYTTLHRVRVGDTMPSTNYTGSVCNIQVQNRPTSLCLKHLSVVSDNYNRQLEKEGKGLMRQSLKLGHTVQYWQLALQRWQALLLRTRMPLQALSPNTTTIPADAC